MRWNNTFSLNSGGFTGRPACDVSGSVDVSCVVTSILLKLRHEHTQRPRSLGYVLGAENVPSPNRRKVWCLTREGEVFVKEKWFQATLSKGCHEACFSPRSSMPSVSKRRKEPIVEGWTCCHQQRLRETPSPTSREGNKQRLRIRASCSMGESQRTSPRRVAHSSSQRSENRQQAGKPYGDAKQRPRSIYRNASYKDWTVGTSNRRPRIRTEKLTLGRVVTGILSDRHGQCKVASVGESFTGSLKLHGHHRRRDHLAANRSLTHGEHSITQANHCQEEAAIPPPDKSGGLLAENP